MEEMSVHWKAWGETAGVSGAKLAGFEKQYHHDNGDCMSATVRVWMQLLSEEVKSTRLCAL